MKKKFRYYDDEEELDYEEYEKLSKKEDRENKRRLKNWERLQDEDFSERSHHPKYK